MPTSRKRELARVLSGVDRFDHPRVDLEQYPTPPDLAAAIIHLADLRGDIDDQYVVDLGSGPGILAIGAAFRNPAQVVGIEIDPASIETARKNVESVTPPVTPEWILGDAMNPPLCPTTGATLLMNPPFGAQRGNIHADRQFLRAAIPLAAVTYSVHNAGSRSFIESFAADNGGEVTDAISMKMDLERQFSFHDLEETSIDTELYRIEWRS